MTERQRVLWDTVIGCLMSMEIGIDRRHPMQAQARADLASTAMHTLAGLGDVTARKIVREVKTTQFLNMFRALGLEPRVLPPPGLYQGTIVAKKPMDSHPNLLFFIG